MREFGQSMVAICLVAAGLARRRPRPTRTRQRRFLRPRARRSVATPSSWRLSRSWPPAGHAKSAETTWCRLSSNRVRASRQVRTQGRDSGAGKQSDVERLQRRSTGADPAASTTARGRAGTPGSRRATGCGGSRTRLRAARGRGASRRPSACHGGTPPATAPPGAAPPGAEAVRAAGPGPAGPGRAGGPPMDPRRARVNGVKQDFVR